MVVAHRHRDEIDLEVVVPEEPRRRCHPHVLDVVPYTHSQHIPEARGDVVVAQSARPAHGRDVQVRREEVLVDVGEDGPDVQGNSAITRRSAGVELPQDLLDELLLVEEIGVALLPVLQPHDPPLKV